MVTSSAHSRSEPTGMPMAMRVTLHAQRLQEPGQVDGRGLALDGRARGQDDLFHAARAHALEQALDLQLVRAHALQRRERAVQDVVAALEVARALDGQEVVRLLHDADDAVRPAGVACRSRRPRGR